MRQPLVEVGELSLMKSSSTVSDIESLRGNSGKYVNRLSSVADATRLRGDLLGGTTISRPAVIAQGHRNRLQREVMPIGFAMYVREIETPVGRLVMFPMHTVGVTNEGRMIIDPALNKESYSIAHVVHESNDWSHGYFSPADSVVDLVFTVDSDNLVTTNGMNPVTADEYRLFDEIVCEFEQRAFGAQPHQDI
jgi:hypothetical protein